MEYKTLVCSWRNLADRLNREAKLGWRLHSFSDQDSMVGVVLEKEVSDGQIFDPAASAEALPFDARTQQEAAEA